MNQQQSQMTDVNLQLLQQYNLGSFMKMYKGSSWGCLIPVVIFMVIWVTGVFVWYEQFWEHVEHIMPLYGIVFITIAFTFMISIGIGLLVMLIIGMHRGISKGNLNAYLYEYGFIYCTSKGIVEQVVRWTDITVFQHKVVKHSSTSSSGSTSTTYSDVYTITLRNTEKPVRLSFGKEFAKAVECAVANWHYPFARTAYWSGSMARFGRLAIWPQGTYDTTNRATLPWSEVESIKVSSHGGVSIKKIGERHAWAFFPVGALDNPEVLRRLIATEVPYRFEVLLSR